MPHNPPDQVPLSDPEARALARAFWRMIAELRRQKQAQSELLAEFAGRDETSQLEMEREP